MTAIISLDMKKKRIRIHRSTLELLKNPSNIHILINPQTNKIALCPSRPEAKDSIKLQYGPDVDCELYSTELMEQLSYLSPQFDLTYTYRIIGEVIPDKGIALFDLTDATKLDPSGKAEANDTTRSIPNEY